MNLTDIPVRVVGPGSQPEVDGADTPKFIDMPGNMETFRAPHVDAAIENAASLAQARETMCWLMETLQSWPLPRNEAVADLGALDAANRELVNQLLGEGEVSVVRDCEPRARSQETVLAGVWRTLYLDEQDRVVADMLEVAPSPHVMKLPDRQRRAIDASDRELPADVVNALPILVELEARHAEFVASGTTHTVNLTLLPVDAADLEFLEARLGKGAVDSLSRAYGECRVASTLAPDIWWVRYFNSMGVLILNTIEITALPAVVCAAPEDLADSARRLGAIVAPYWPELR